MFSRCGAIGCEAALVREDYYVLESTDGPVEHVFVQCSDGHWANMPVSLKGGAG